MAIITKSKNEDVAISIKDVEVGFFKYVVDNAGGISAEFQITNPTEFFKTTEGTKDLTTAVADAVAVAKAKLPVTE